MKSVNEETEREIFRTWEPKHKILNRARAEAQNGVTMRMVEKNNDT